MEAGDSIQETRNVSATALRELTALVIECIRMSLKASGDRTVLYRPESDCLQISTRALVAKSETITEIRNP